MLQLCIPFYGTITFVIFHDNDLIQLAVVKLNPFWPNYPLSEKCLIASGLHPLSYIWQVCC